MGALYDDMLSSIPEGSSGNWSVRKFSVSKDKARFGALTGRGRYVPEGDYTGLYRGGTVIMSDTPDELRDHYQPLRMARGVCLVNGLGLGCIAEGMLRKENVEKVIVIEKSEDVINLVGPTLKERYGDRLEIRHADAYDYKPPKGERYHCVWHDIWDNLCTDNLSEMTKLHRKYGRRADWQGSWGKELLKRYKQREDSQMRRWRW